MACNYALIHVEHGRGSVNRGAELAAVVAHLANCLDCPNPPARPPSTPGLQAVHDAWGRPRSRRGNGDTRSWYGSLLPNQPERAAEVLTALFEAARVHGTWVQVRVPPAACGQQIPGRRRKFGGLCQDHADAVFGAEDPPWWRLDTKTQRDIVQDWLRGMTIMAHGRAPRERTC